MQILSPITDIQPLAKKGFTTEKLSPDINAPIITQSPEALGEHVQF